MTTAADVRYLLGLPHNISFAALSALGMRAPNAATHLDDRN